MARLRPAPYSKSLPAPRAVPWPTSVPTASAIASQLRSTTARRETQLMLSSSAATRQGLSLRWARLDGLRHPTVQGRPAVAASPTYCAGVRKACGAARCLASDARLRKRRGIDRGRAFLTLLAVRREAGDPRFCAPRLRLTTRRMRGEPGFGRRPRRRGCATKATVTGSVRLPNASGSPSSAESAVRRTTRAARRGIPSRRARLVEATRLSCERSPALPRASRTRPPRRAGSSRRTARRHTPGRR